MLKFLAAIIALGRLGKYLDNHLGIEERIKLGIFELRFFTGNDAIGVRVESGGGITDSHIGDKGCAIAIC